MVTVLEEINALIGKDTWEMIDLLKDERAVGCKWVFTVTYKLDGTMERYKARLMAQGFTQDFRHRL